MQEDNRSDATNSPPGPLSWQERGNIKTRPFSFPEKGLGDEFVHGGLMRCSSAGLGFGQLFFLIFGFLVTSALIFFFGMWVGRDVAERRLAQEERVVRLPMPAPPTAKAEGAEADVDTSFYQELKEKAYRRLQETAAPVSPTAAQAAATPTTAPLHLAEAPTKPPTRPAATPSKPPTRAAMATKPPARVAERLTPTPKRPLPTPPELNPDEWAGGGWTVQVNATTDIQQATELARGLKAKGYDAYTVQSPIRGQTWYRVRVGIFSSREKAKEVESKLKTVEGLENAYVTAR